MKRCCPCMHACWMTGGRSAKACAVRLGRGRVPRGKAACLKGMILRNECNAEAAAIVQSGKVAMPQRQSVRSS